MLYDLSFTFTNPKDSKDVNHIHHAKNLNKENYRCWISQIYTAVLKGQWIISNLTTKQHN